jgi:hypothetical protein
MKTYFFNRTALRICASASIIFVVTMIWSCNKDFETRLASANKNDTANVNLKMRKVLYIIVDGVRGEALKSLNAPNIARMTKNSIYAYNSLTDYGSQNVTNAGSWADMLTGVRADKHLVSSEDFLGNKLGQYPSLFTRLKQANTGLRTVAIGASPAFVTSLGADATEKKTYADDDAAVKNAVNLALENNDVNLIVAQFHTADKVGQLNGYSATAPAYVNAILQLDTYIGDIVSNLTERPDFLKENWLVIVASNKGGNTTTPRTDNTSYGDDSRNNFIVFYNPRFSTQVVPKPASDQIPYAGTAPIFYGGDNENRKAIVANDAGLYNFGTKDFTLQFKFKTNGVVRNYPIFIHKGAGIINESSPGWLLYLAANHYSLNVGGNGVYYNFSSNSDVNDGKWHTITVIFNMQGAKRFVKCMTDGVVTNAGQDITNAGSLDNSSPLQMGHKLGATASPDILIKELQIYNVALTEANVAAYYRQTFVESTHPYYNNLISYWPADEGTGNTIYNKSSLPVAKNKNFILTGTYEWRSFSDISPVIDPPISPEFYKVVPNNVDIPFQIYQWMGIPVPSLWALDGKSWNPTYTDVKP